MSAATYALGIVFAIAALAAVLDLLRRNKLRERHALWWLVGSFLGLIIAVFPALINNVATFFGIEAPSNLVFFLSIAILVLVCVQSSAELKRVEDRTRILNEEVTLLKIRVERLEHAAVTAHNADTPDNGTDA